MDFDQRTDASHAVGWSKSYFSENICTIIYTKYIKSTYLDHNKTLKQTQYNIPIDQTLINLRNQRQPNFRKFSDKKSLHLKHLFEQRNVELIFRNF